MTPAQPRSGPSRGAAAELAGASPVGVALDPEQLAVVHAPPGPVGVLAGAGTGKTRAITNRIAYRVQQGTANADAVLALTFTTRAAGEMRARLRALGVPAVQSRTFHSAALRQLRHFWPDSVGGAFPQLVQTKAPLVAAALADSGLAAGQTRVRDMAAEIEWAKVTRTVPDDYVAAATATHRPPPDGMTPHDVAATFERYEGVKRSRSMMDMEDVLLLTVALLEQNPDITRTVRARYRHVVVDEYQDVNPVQQALLDTWLGERDDLCVVGDPAQTIYSFTGARPDYLLQFPSRHPGAAMVHLVRNYRSTPQIVGAANQVLRRSRAISVRPTPLLPQLPDGAAVEFTETSDDVAEALALVDWVKQSVASGIALEQIAVLYRINSQSQTLETELGQAGIGYVVKGGMRYFERPEVRRGLVLLRGGAPGIRSREAAGDPLDLAAEVAALLGPAGLTSEQPASGAARDAWAALDALVEHARRFAVLHTGVGVPGDARGAGASPGDARSASVYEGFLADLGDRADHELAPAVSGVTLASLHAAKGLEWDAVAIVGVHEGLLPYQAAETPAEVEEERRLLYVGVTRARARLRLSWSTSRNPGGPPTRRPSRFLDGVRPIGSSVHDSGSESGVRRTRSESPRQRDGERARPMLPVRCTGCQGPLTDAAERRRGRCQDCPVTYDEGRFEALREWRRVRAAEDSVPAYVVFSDATLEALAEHLPTDKPGLLRLPGIGAVKVERYGDSVLAILSGAISEDSP